jgi:hypothetical protein
MHVLFELPLNPFPFFILQKTPLPSEKEEEFGAIDKFNLLKTS